MQVALGSSPINAQEIERAWAKARLENLVEQNALTGGVQHQNRSEIISLALEFHLASPYTAFVAVDREEQAAGKKPRRLQVSQPLPEGLDLSGFVGRGVLPPMPVGMPPPMAAMSPIPQPSAARNTSAPLFSAPQIDLPAFMRKRTGARKALAESSMPSTPSKQEDEKAIKADASPADRETILRSLARSQKMNGSWNEDVEYTAAVLLAFVRGGYTERKGHYRVPVKRAAAWLKKNVGKGMAAVTGCVALAELALADGAAADRQAALALVAGRLKEPGQMLADVLAGQINPPAAPRTFDEFRLAVLAGTKPAVPADLSRWAGPELAEAWLAAMG
jgi:hypothetical protein